MISVPASTLPCLPPSPQTAPHPCLPAHPLSWVKQGRQCDAAGLGLWTGCCLCDLGMHHRVRMLISRHCGQTRSPFDGCPGPAAAATTPLTAACTAPPADAPHPLSVPCSCWLPHMHTKLCAVPDAVFSHCTTAQRQPRRPAACVERACGAGWHASIRAH